MHEQEPSILISIGLTNCAQTDTRDYYTTGLITKKSMEIL